MFHPLNSLAPNESLPELFNSPFRYQPHPLCIKAAKEVIAYVSRHPEWEKPSQEGKMFGVLLVKDAANRIGYLASFSGNLIYNHPDGFFVPSLFDYLAPDGYFAQEEKRIFALNTRIDELENASSYADLQHELDLLKNSAHQAIDDYKKVMAQAKLQRNEQRNLCTDEDIRNQLLKESQFQKAELKRIKKHYQQRIEEKESELTKIRIQIDQLKTKRKADSIALQRWLFDQFIVHNAHGEAISLTRLFEEKIGNLPPAGTGECAGPKLMEYAFRNGYTPLAIAEFWYGRSPKTELRQQGYFYPACKNKCEPLLTYMLQGMEVEQPLLPQGEDRLAAISILHEDEWLIVLNKPHGMLSVPGKSQSPSVVSWLKQRYPHATGPMLVHRLDMDTSGILIAAKTKEVHQMLQAQFTNRSVQKEYVALLTAPLKQKHGTIDLPLCLNPDDRPRQMVNSQLGKPALTEYSVIEHNKVRLFPHTGRTHQLRLHCAHPQGLNTPIKGDPLYGQPADRLYLHAYRIVITHPITKQQLEIVSPPKF